MRWLRRSQNAIALDDPLPTLGNLLLIGDPRCVPHAQTFADDLLGPLNAQTDAREVAAALILAYAIRNPDLFLLQLSLAMESQAAALLTAYARSSDELVAAAPHAKTLLRKGLKRYAAFDPERQQQIVALFARCSMKLSEIDLTAETLTEYGRAVRRALAASLAVVSIILVYVSPAWWQTAALAAAGILWVLPFQRRSCQWKTPREVRETIYRRVQITHQTYLRARRLIADIGRDARWARPGLGSPRLTVAACEMRWARILGWIAPVTTVEEKADFMLPLDLHLERTIAYDRDLLSRALHKQLLKADQDYAMRLRLADRRRSRGRVEHQGEDAARWLGTPAAAKRIGMSEPELRDLAKEGKIAHRKRGRVYRFRPEVLDAYLKSGGSQSPLRQ